MPGDWLREQFRLDGQVAIVTGGGGALGSAMAHGLAQAGARVVLLGRTQTAPRPRPQPISPEPAAMRSDCLADVHDRAQLVSVRDDLGARFGRIDILINAAGGNVPAATLPPGDRFSTSPSKPFTRSSISTSSARSCHARSSAR